jgi:hypothetical protein
MDKKIFIAMPQPLPHYVFLSHKKVPAIADT